MSGQNQKTDKRIAWPIIIMNFTGVYDYEAFARNNKFIWLDCRHLYGTDGYCECPEEKFCQPSSCMSVVSL